VRCQITFFFSIFSSRCSAGLRACFFFEMIRSGSWGVADGVIPGSIGNRGREMMKGEFVRLSLSIRQPVLDPSSIVSFLMFTSRKNGQFVGMKERVPAGCSATGTAVIPISPGGRGDNPQQRDNRYERMDRWHCPRDSLPESRGSQWVP
jgi:hypothetical protein